MKTPAAILCFLLTLPNAASAEWVHATGSYIFPPTMSEAEACQQAETRARAEAVRQVTGETLSSEDVMRCTEHREEAECARNSTVWVMVGGEIRAIRDRQASTTHEIENFRKCTVSFAADVHVADGLPDPNFDLGVTINNAVFRVGENLRVNLNPSQSMAVQIFLWLPYERGEAQVVRIFPNRAESFDRIDQPTTIPTQEGAKRYDLRATFPAGQPTGRRMVDEYLMVVATKRPVAFRDSYSLDDFNRLISEIPLGDRRIVRRAYSIVRGAE